MAWALGLVAVVAVPEDFGDQRREALDRDR